MPSVIKLRIVEAKDLPVMDRKSELTDAYVEIRFADTPIQRTTVARKTLNPEWNQDFRIEVADDCLLQDEPIELKVWDQDVVTSDDVIGSVVIDINSLLMRDPPGVVTGWLPIFDTIRGICGQLSVVVKIEFFGDVNPLKDSSAGLQFFSSNTPQRDYRIRKILGFVEELVTEEDPEYQWADNFRTSRRSNFARQLLFYKLSGRIRRQLGRRVLELGGNCVLGFNQEFDFEDEIGIVARGYGTACFVLPERVDLTPRFNLSEGKPPPLPHSPTSAAMMAGRVSPISPSRRYPSKSPGSRSPSTSPSSMFSSELNAVPPRRLHLSRKPESSWGSKIAGSVEEPVSKLAISRELDVVQLITLVSFPKQLKLRMGGVVTARAVKLLRSTRRLEEMRDLRDEWWSEVREEVRAHARALGCYQVVGYTETTTINDDVCVLTGYGTAVTLRLANKTRPYIASRDTLKKRKKRGRKLKKEPKCSSFHVPYSSANPPFQMSLTPCLMCRSKYVPEIVLSTIEAPEECPLVGEPALLEARVCRVKKNIAEGANATQVSDILPFLEYDLHSQLLCKMKVVAANVAFGLRLSLSIGDHLIAATATCTAIHCPALPLPPSVQFNRTLDVVDKEDEELIAIQKRIEERSEKNRRLLKEEITDSYPDQLSKFDSDSGKQASASPLPPKSPIDTDSDSSSGSSGSSSSSTSDDSLVEIVPPVEDKKTFVVEIDDAADEEELIVLLDSLLPPGVSVVTTENMLSSHYKAKANAQLVTVMKRVRWKSTNFLNRKLQMLFEELYSRLCFKVRELTPCRIFAATPELEIFDNYVVQASIVGTVVLLQDKTPRNPIASHDVSSESPLGVGGPSTGTIHAADLPPNMLVSTGSVGSVGSCSSIGGGGGGSGGASAHEDSLMFKLEQESSGASPPPFTSQRLPSAVPPPLWLKTIEITPMSYIPGAHIEQYLGRVSLHLIKESWTVREEGGLGNFSYVFLTEAQAIARAHVAALGGNALIGYKMVECKIDENYNRNQVYSMIWLSGDAVAARYDKTTHGGLEKIGRLNCGSV